MKKISRIKNCDQNNFITQIKYLKLKDSFHHVMTQWGLSVFSCVNIFILLCVFKNLWLVESFVNLSDWSNQLYPFLQEFTVRWWLIYGFIFISSSGERRSFHVHLCRSACLYVCSFVEKIVYGQKVGFWSSCKSNKLARMRRRWGTNT